MMSEVSHHTSDSVQGEIFCLSAIYPYAKTALSDDISAFQSTSDPDTMYLHQLMREPDRKKIKSHAKRHVRPMENGKLSLIKRTLVPKGKSILPSVWHFFVHGF